jgi:hypothetical protein
MVMTIMVIALALLCLFIVLGYSIDKNGQAEQGGLIQFRSFPDNASVSIDGKTQGFNTPGKSTADATQHSVNIFKKDYRNWSKSFSLGRGELLWLNARLLPNSITTTETEQFESVSQMIASPDKKWIAVLEKANEPNLKIIDLRDEKQPKMTAVTIPASIIKTLSPTDSFVISEWDFGSRFLLVKHVSGGTTQWLRLDRTNEANVENISAHFKLHFDKLHFIGTSGDNYYGLGAGTLRRLSLSQADPPVVISQNVSEFSLYGDNKIALVSQKNNQQIAQVYRNGDKSPTVVETFPELQPAVHAAITSFFGDDYAAISQGGDAKLIKQPFNSHPTTITKIHQVPEIIWLYFSPNGQFLMTQNGVDVSGYNLERDLPISFTIPGQEPYARTEPLQWLDDFHFWSDMGGTLRMFEFDGTNPEVIGNVTAGHDVTLSDNGKRLFSIGVNATTNKPVLQSSVMVVE